MEPIRLPTKVWIQGYIEFNSAENIVNEILSIAENNAPRAVKRKRTESLSSNEIHVNAKLECCQKEFNIELGFRETTTSVTREETICAAENQQSFIPIHMRFPTKADLGCSHQNTSVKITFSLRLANSLYLGDCQFRLAHEKVKVDSPNIVFATLTRQINFNPTPENSPLIDLNQNVAPMPLELNFGVNFKTDVVAVKEIFPVGIIANMLVDTFSISLVSSLSVHLLGGGYFFNTISLATNFAFDSTGEHTVRVIAIVGEKSVTRDFTFIVCKKEFVDKVIREKYYWGLVEKVNSIKSVVSSKLRKFCSREEEGDSYADECLISFPNFDGSKEKFFTLDAQKRGFWDLVASICGYLEEHDVVAKLFKDKWISIKSRDFAENFLKDKPSGTTFMRFAISQGGIAIHIKLDEGYDVKLVKEEKMKCNFIDTLLNLPKIDTFARQIEGDTYCLRPKKDVRNYDSDL